MCICRAVEGWGKERRSPLNTHLKKVVPHAQPLFAKTLGSVWRALFNEMRPEKPREFLQEEPGASFLIQSNERPL